MEYAINPMIVHPFECEDCKEEMKVYLHNGDPAQLFIEEVILKCPKYKQNTTK